VQFFVRGYLARTIPNIVTIDVGDALLVAPIVIVIGVLLAAFSASVAIRRYLKV